MKRPRVILQQTVTTEWAPISITGMLGLKSLLIQARTGVDLLLTTKPCGDDSLGYITLKSGTSMSIDMDGRPHDAALSDELLSNGNFGSESGWTWGVGWTLISGVASYTYPDEDEDPASLIRNPIPGETAVVSGYVYKLVYSLTYGSGYLTPSVGGKPGETRSSSSTFTDYIFSNAATELTFLPALISLAANFSVDNVSLKRVLLPDLLFARVAADTAILEIMALL